MSLHAPNSREFGYGSAFLQLQMPECNVRDDEAGGLWGGIGRPPVIAGCRRVAHRSAGIQECKRGEYNLLSGLDMGGGCTLIRNDSNYFQPHKTHAIR